MSTAPAFNLPRPVTRDAARALLAQVGCTLRTVDGEHEVRVKGGRNEGGYFTCDLEDAIGTGRDMAARFARFGR